MNFEFSPEALDLKEQARRFLADKAGPAAARKVMEGKASHDAALWEGMTALGWTAIRIPEAHGGLGLGALELCVLSEEVGRALAPAPFMSSVVRGTEALLIAGHDDLSAGLADGSVILTTAFGEGVASSVAAPPAAAVSHNRLSGVKAPIADAAAATHAVISARAADDGDGYSWWLLDLRAAGITREPVEVIDLVRKHGRLICDGVQVVRLGPAGAGAAMMERWLKTVAVYEAFEALGTAEAAQAMALEYARQRVAFGRKIGGYQAVKHKCADMYIKCVLARSHAYHGAWALNADAPELALASAGARVAAIDAVTFCGEENVQLHGGIGFTWESDCQFYYRRSRLLALDLGSRAWWADRLVRALEQRNAAAA